MYFEVLTSTVHVDLASTTAYRQTLPGTGDLCRWVPDKYSGPELKLFRMKTTFPNEGSEIILRIKTILRMKKFCIHLVRNDNNLATQIFKIQVQVKSYHACSKFSSRYQRKPDHKRQRRHNVDQHLLVDTMTLPAHTQAPTGVQVHRPERSGVGFARHEWF